MDIKKLTAELKAVRERLSTVEVRLTLAQAWVQFLNYAYDALLTHGVNYRTLREYAESTEPDDVQDLPISRARDKIVTWLGRLESAVAAAVRRKGFRKV